MLHMPGRILNHCAAPHSTHSSLGAHQHTVRPVMEMHQSRLAKSADARRGARWRTAACCRSPPFILYTPRHNSLARASDCLTSSDLGVGLNFVSTSKNRNIIDTAFSAFVVLTRAVTSFSHSSVLQVGVADTAHAGAHSGPLRSTALDPQLPRYSPAHSPTGD